jgi:hypothetical protein
MEIRNEKGLGLSTSVIDLRRRATDRREEENARGNALTSQQGAEAEGPQSLSIMAGSGLVSGSK